MNVVSERRASLNSQRCNMDLSHKSEKRVPGKKEKTETKTFLSVPFFSGTNAPPATSTSPPNTHKELFRWKKTSVSEVYHIKLQSECNTRTKNSLIQANLLDSFIINELQPVIKLNHRLAWKVEENFFFQQSKVCAHFNIKCERREILLRFEDCQAKWMSIHFKA